MLEETQRLLQGQCPFNDHCQLEEFGTLNNGDGQPVLQARFCHSNCARIVCERRMQYEADVGATVCVRNEESTKLVLVSTDELAAHQNDASLSTEVHTPRWEGQSARVREVMRGGQRYGREARHLAGFNGEELSVEQERTIADMRARLANIGDDVFEWGNST